MKLQLNIGLSCNNGQKQSVPSVLQALIVQGFQITRFSVHDGEWEGVKEKTIALAVTIGLPDCPSSREAIRHLVFLLANELHQDCIAVLWGKDSGELIPSSQYDFDPNLFSQP